MSEAKAAKEKLQELVTFYLEEEQFGIDVDDVLEVNRELVWTHIPGAPKIVLGAANLRGEIVTIIDIRRVLGFGQRPEGLSNPVIIVSSRNELVGILVDRIADVLEVDPAFLEPPPENMPDKLRDCIASVMKLEGGLIAVLNLETSLA